MKQILVPVAFFTLLFSGCKTSQITSYSDDIYSSPKEERRLAKIAEEEKAKRVAAEKLKQEEEALAQKAKDDANPYYQDPQYNSDDYYDYKYASQMRRFNNNSLYTGMGYYDSYYTNAYMYNQNPYSYGTSIYSSYNYWMPSNQFYGYSNGLSLVFSTGNYYGNNGFGYNPYYGYGNTFCGVGNPYWGNPYYDPFYNPYFSPYYSPYYAGYMNGFNNGFYNGTNWGYYNSFDVNSSYSNMTYGPRGSNGGGNGPRGTNPGMAIPDGMSERTQFVNAVAVKQETTPRFTEVPHKKVTSVNSENYYNGNVNTGTSSTPRSNGNTENYSNHTTESNPVKNTPRNENTGFWPKLGWNENANTTTTNPVKNTGNGNSENVNTNPVKTGGGRNTSTNNNPGKNSGTYENSNSNSGSNSGGSGKSQGSIFENNNSNSNSNPTRNSGTFEMPSNSNSSGGNNGGSSTPRGSGGGGGNRPR
ncbi:MAG: cell envelope integrity protein TolA [Bacteroidia bacterium]|nr:cell envelope integrity protein TolA [Bacteroidia bacterium]